MRTLCLLLALAAPAAAQTYSATTIPAGFVDIAATGTLLASADDAISPATAFPGGFTFPFFGTPQGAFRVSTNGWITFDTATTASQRTNSPIPTSAAPNALLAVLWDDLVARTTSGGGVWGRLDDRGTADPADDRYIVQWTGFFYNTPARALAAQAQLYRSGVVEYHYQTLTTPDFDYTIGIESPSGTFGTQTYHGTSTTTPGAGTPASTAAAFRYVYLPPTGPFFVLTPAEPTALGTAGACAATAARTATFTVVNAGIGTLAVTGAATAGSPAFSVDTGTLPASLGAGQTVALTVTFAPAAGQAGPLAAQLTVQYDDGAPRTSAPVALSGTATAANTTFASGVDGAGIAFRTSQTNACAALAPTPPAPAALIPFAGHTRLTGFVATDPDVFPALDDGAREVTAAEVAALLGPGRALRFFGAPTPSFWINTNASVTFGEPAGGFYGGLPTGTGFGSLQAAALDLTLNTDPDAGPSYEADDAGVGGPPGVFLGAEDVDGDGDADLVVTWYHAYASGSDVYDGTPESGAEYVTVQLVIAPADAPNEDARAEVRFPTGDDANGVPWRLNTDGTIEPGAHVGVADPTGLAATIYRTPSGGGPLDDGGGPLGVAFTPATQATAVGGAGWRMLGVPLEATTVRRLADLNLVQGVAGQYPDAAGGTNVLTGYNGAAFVPAASIDDVLERGRGVLWYLYDQTVTPDPAADGGGTSRSVALPMALQATGDSPPGDVTVALTAAGDGFSLVANPYRRGLALDPADVATWSDAGLLSAVAQTWDPAEGTYTTLADDVAAPWQGFWLQSDVDAGTTELYIPDDAQTDGGTLVGRTAPRPALAFTLAGADAATGAPTRDRAARLALADAATDGWDVFDALKLAPLAGVYATVGIQAAGPRGEPAVKAEESRAPGAASFELPLVVDAAGTAPDLTLSWAGVEGLPADWALSLRDLATGAVVDLRAQAAYAFEHAAAAARGAAPTDLLARTTTAAQAAAATAPRFVLAVTARAVAAEADAPRAYALAAPAPNPAGASAAVAFEVPAAATVELALFDALGRRVATLAEGPAAVGRHTARLDTARLAPGVYALRLTAASAAGTFEATRRLTVVR